MRAKSRIFLRPAILVFALMLLAIGTLLGCLEEQDFGLAPTGSSGGDGGSGNSAGVPANAAVGVSFTDTDPDGGQIAGDVVISKAGNESDVTSYVLYWGSSPTSKQSETPIATLTATGFNLTHTFVANTAVPSGATDTEASSASSTVVKRS